MTPLVHKAAEPDSLTIKGKKRYARLVADATVNQKGLNDVIVQPKHDGVYAQFVFEAGHWAAYSRTGEHLRAVSPDVLREFENNALPNRRYNGELWLPNVQHSEINGRSRKHSPQYLEVVLFDSFNAAPLAQNEPYIERYEYLFTGNLVKPVRNLPVAGTLFSEQDLFDLARDITLKTSAYDGLMLKDPLGLYIPGAGKDGETIKIKPRKSGDFRVVGTTKGAGNRAGGIGALVVDLGGGVVTDVGSGLSLVDVFDRGADYFVGKIVEVEYLSITKDGKLREPSYKGVRNDKTEADVLQGNVPGKD